MSRAFGPRARRPVHPPCGRRSRANRFESRRGLDGPGHPVDGCHGLGSRAQSAPDPELAPAPVCTSTLDVHAVEDTTHEAVAAATVTVDGRPAGETDDDGLVLVRGLCPGDIEVVVERADYVPGRARSRSMAHASLELELVQLGETIEIRGHRGPPADPTDMRSNDGSRARRSSARAAAASPTQLAEVPGVSQLRSASGMAKPIIRGQFGRRLLMLVDGVRHRSQEWGLDHAPEIDPFVADKLTVVRGAAGVRYGPDAIGGAVLVEPPELLRAPGLAGEVHLIGVSNGRGGSFAGAAAARRSAAVPGLALAGSRAASSASRRRRRPTTRSTTPASLEWNVGATARLSPRRRRVRSCRTATTRRSSACARCLRIESRRRLLRAARSRSTARLGAVRVRLRDRATVPGGRPRSRAGARARGIAMASASLIATYAFQHDHRREYDVVRDATTGPQFNFRLITHELELVLEHNPIHLSDHLHLRGAAGSSASPQIHHYSGLPLVPDHTVVRRRRLRDRAPDRSRHRGRGRRALRRCSRARASIERARLPAARAQRAAREDACGDQRRSRSTARRAFTRCRHRSARCASSPTSWSIKLELSTASRPPNPDEQYLNGTVADVPGARARQAGSRRPRPRTRPSVTTALRRASASPARLSAYANLIDDYIYFAPAIDADGEPIFDVLIRGTFPRFVTRPVDAVFYGADGGIAVAPRPMLELGAQVSMVRATQRQRRRLPRVRAARSLSRLGDVQPPTALGVHARASSPLSGTLRDAAGRASISRADFAPPPPAYFLARCRGRHRDPRLGDQTVKLALAGHQPHEHALPRLHQPAALLRRPAGLAAHDAPQRLRSLE